MTAKELLAERAWKTKCDNREVPIPVGSLVNVDSPHFAEKCVARVVGVMQDGVHIYTCDFVSGIKPRAAVNSAGKLQLIDSEITLFGEAEKSGEPRGVPPVTQARLNDAIELYRKSLVLSRQFAKEKAAIFAAAEAGAVIERGPLDVTQIPGTKNRSYTDIIVAEFGKAKLDELQKKYPTGKENKWHIVDAETQKALDSADSV